MLPNIDDLLEYLTHRKGVVGICLTGSYARGEADRYSDIDLGVFCRSSRDRNRLSKNIPHDIEFRGHIAEFRFYDLRSYEKEPLPKGYFQSAECAWSLENRFNFSLAKILWDPQEKVAKLFKKKLIFSKVEQKRVESDLDWTLNANLNYHVPRLCQAERYVEAQMLLDESVNALIKFIYARNRLFFPPAKALLFWFRQRAVLKPRSMDPLFVNRACKKSDVQQRCKSIQKICRAFHIHLKKDSIEQHMNRWEPVAWEIFLMLPTP